MPISSRRAVGLLVVAMAAVAGAACGGSATAPAAPAVAVASGQVFALMDPGASASTLQAYAALPSVDGLAFRVLWSSLEPAAGTYDWTALDTALAVARRQGKTITIHVAPSAGGLPGWLGSLGMRSYSYVGPQGPRTDPVPWDSVYLARYRAFVTAMGAHVRATGNMELVASVSDPVPEPEMTIVGCQNHQLTGGIAYDRATYLAAWDSTISTYAGAFPGIRLFISSPIAFICANDGNDGQAFYTDVMRYASSATGHAAVFAADLTALGSQRMAQAASLPGAPAVGLQTIWSYSSDPQNRMQGSLTDAVCHGWRLGARYFEIYQPDLSSADASVQAAIGSARTGQGC
ncbi:MAG TPA: beta-galactosidase [Gemmatimonadaceae bacterium]|nr:beta-galactosidase [Gemmatimonadaceae bacterium]